MPHFQEFEELVLMSPVLGDVEREHAVDDVADGFGEAGNFAGAGPAERWREFKGDRRRWGERVR